MLKKSQFAKLSHCTVASYTIHKISRDKTYTVLTDFMQSEIQYIYQTNSLQHYTNYKMYLKEQLATSYVFLCLGSNFLVICYSCKNVMEAERCLLIMPHIHM